GADPALLLHAEKRRIKRALVKIERALGDSLDPFREAEAVLGTEGVQRTENDQVERALENRGFRVFFRHPRGVWSFPFWMSRGECGQTRHRPSFFVVCFF